MQHMYSEQQHLQPLGYPNYLTPGYPPSGGYTSAAGGHAPAPAPSVLHPVFPPQPHVPSPRPQVQLSDIQQKLMALAGQPAPQQPHLPPLHNQHEVFQKQARPLPLPVPLMSIKVPFPKHLRTHPRVRPRHPRIPRNKLFAHRSPQVDPNPIITNLKSLNCYYPTSLRTHLHQSKYFRGI